VQQRKNGDNLIGLQRKIYRFPEIYASVRKNNILPFKKQFKMYFLSQYLRISWRYRRPIIVLYCKFIAKFS